jgi:hypothetical protein
MASGADRTESNLLLQPAELRYSQLYRRAEDAGLCTMLPPLIARDARPWTTQRLPEFNSLIVELDGILCYLAYSRHPRLSLRTRSDSCTVQEQHHPRFGGLQAIRLAITDYPNLRRETRS